MRKRLCPLDLCNNERLAADFCRSRAHGVDVRGARGLLT
jgi:hypothetical protein